MHNRQGSLVPAVIVILAIAAFIGMFAFAIWPKPHEFDVQTPVVKTKITNTVGANTNAANVNVTTNANTNVSITNTNSSADITVGWKTYTSTENDFQIQYPPDWKTEKPLNNTGVIALYRTSTTQTYPDPKKPLDGYITIDKIANPDNLSLQQVFDKAYKDCLSVPNNQLGCPAAQKASSYTSITINGVNGLKGEAGSVLPGIGAYFFQDGYYVDVLGTNYNLHNTYDFNTAYNQILSTFKILNPTVGWKTYSNTANHYSLKYPSNYTQSINGGTIQFEKDGSAQQSALQLVTVSVFSGADQNINADLDLYSWAKNGFSKTASIVSYHNNPREVRLGSNTFIKTDGDQASSGIPEYFLFHNNVLYELTDLHSSALQSNNQTIISTFTLTK